MAEDLEALGLTEIIQLQNELSKTLQRRFGRDLALAFTDVVGSTEYFQRAGDEAGRRLLQRNVDLLAAAIAPAGGRIVDTAGDGAFSCFPRAEAGAQALLELQGAIARDNAGFSREHQLQVRAGLHFGPVLTDERIVTGDAVNLCARVAALARGGEIRITREAFQELPGPLRLRCAAQPAAEAKGIARPLETLSLEWRDWTRFPRAVRIEETGEEILLPSGLDLISFGRLREKDGKQANDVVLRVADPQATQGISRWAFELRRLPDGFRMRTLTDRATAVGGLPVAPGADVPIAPGSVVSLGGAITLTFIGNTRLAGKPDDEQTTERHIATGGVPDAAPSPSPSP
jgi:class 3 adenylate cyclase